MSRVTKSDIAFFVSQYRNGETMSDIAKAWGCNRSTVKYWLEREGVKLRSASDLARTASGHYLDECVFDTITPESAYWIGFLMADGAIHKNTVALCLSNCDERHVEKFRHFMGGNQRLITIHGNDAVRYAFESFRIVTKLAEYGVYERKSRTASAPGILLHNRHFWRGVVDGDGHLAIRSHRGKPQARFELVGSEIICNQFAAYVDALLPDRKCVVARRKTIYGIAITGKYAQTITSHLYDNCDLYLDRKKSTALRISEM